MCLAIPGQIIKINSRQATVKYIYQETDGTPHSETRSAMIGERGVNPGDYVMVQMGIVVKKLNKQEAKQTLAAWRPT